MDGGKNQTAKQSRLLRLLGVPGMQAGAISGLKYAEYC